MQLRGSSIFIAGSASPDTTNRAQDLDYAHRFVSALAPLLLDQGATIILGALQEDNKAPNGLDLVFDWRVLRAVSEHFHRPNAIAPSRPVVRVIVEEEQIKWANTSAGQDKRDLWNNMGTEHLLFIDPLQQEPSVKRKLYEKRAAASDVVIVLGGGAGVGQDVDRCIEFRKHVVPMDFRLGARNEPGEGEGLRLANLARTHHSDYFRFKENKTSQALADFLGLSILHNADPVALAKKTLAFLDVLRSPTKVVFIGHGGSLVWERLRRHLRETLNLEVTEFTETSPAGHLSGAIIKKMLDATEFAFIIMTGEDEWLDGTKHARENVIHEAGLFQGKLGFEKAILLIEDGCRRFSNIQSLQYIRFGNNIQDAYPEIEAKLRDAGVL